MPSLLWTVKAPGRYMVCIYAHKQTLLHIKQKYILKKKRLGMVAHDFNLSTLGAEIGGFLEFKAS